MRSLLIVRHAKSSWKEPGLTDHDRPLNKRGRSDAPRMGAWLGAHNLKPDLIVSSTAKRARQTVKRVAAGGGFDCAIDWREEVYHGVPADLVDILRTVGPERQRVMIVGHNPGLEALVRGLTGDAAAMPTAAVALVALDIVDWSQLRLNGSATLVDVWLPRELPDAPP